MSPSIPRSERNSQNRVTQLFTTLEADGGLGYEYLGNWSKREKNRATEVDLLRTNLAARGYSPAHISAAKQKLEIALDVTGITSYQANLKPINYCTTAPPARPSSPSCHGRMNNRKLWRPQVPCWINTIQPRGKFGQN